MAPFKFEVNWMFNGVDMTSQMSTHLYGLIWEIWSGGASSTNLSHMGLYKEFVRSYLSIKYPICFKFEKKPRGHEMQRVSIP